MENERMEETAVQENRPDHGRKRYFWGGVLTGVCGMLVIGGIVLLCTLMGRTVPAEESGQEAQKQQSGAVEEIEVEEGSVVNTDTLLKIQSIEDLIKDNYYRDEDIVKENMEAGIYRGLVDSLGDVYSVYYTPEELEELMQNTQGIYYGIGAGVSIDTATQYPVIIKVYDGTPSQEAGLRENDIIYEVNGESTYGLELTEVVNRIKGEEGTLVNLTIFREGESDYLSIDVQRRKVDIPTVEYEMLDGGMAYVIISEFGDKTEDQFTEALAMARAEGMRGLIIDLRGNPGGTLSSVVAICKKLLPQGLIVYTEDKYGERKEYVSSGAKQLEVPLVVMINGYSASASEILAGAVKDHGIGTLVGTTTYGKGVVQSVIPLEDGSAVKVTVSSYFTPSGTNIHGTGIAPDIECEFDSEAYYNEPGQPDNQLEKAREILLQKINMGAIETASR